MKQVINHKVYNTETATILATFDNGHSHTDFAYLKEDLYVTAKGSYFLAGEGGASTKYREVSGNSTGPGEKIIPLTGKEALDWCEATKNHETALERFKIEEA